MWRLKPSVRVSVTVGDCIICRISMKIDIVFRNKFSSKFESWLLQQPHLLQGHTIICEGFFFYFTFYKPILAKSRARHLYMTLSEIHEFLESLHQEDHIFLIGVNKRHDTIRVLLH
jgi:hypothetical protein